MIAPLSESPSTPPSAPGAAPRSAARPGYLAGRVALVTGGGTGIGAAIALALAEAGARVTITGRTESALLEVARGHELMTAAVCDVTDAAACDAVIGAVAPDIVVANAGMSLSAPFARTDAEQLRALLEVNVIGVHNTFRAALDARTRAREAASADGAGADDGHDASADRHGAMRLIAIASTAALRGYPYVSAYAAAKHAVLGLVRSLALELARDGATVNAVCPGYTETPMLRRSVENIMQRTGRNLAAAEAPLLAGNPQGRFVQGDEVADAVLWLAGPSAASVTGQAISISGGETM